MAVVHYKPAYKKYLLIVSRIFVGVVFLFSGFVKAVDPLGSTYKFTDYFTAFGFENLSFLAFPLAVFLSSIEFVIGFMLVFNVKTKQANLLALIFMIFFTPLTLYLAIYNPVSDCGCFGDALVISNWQTFWKNIIIDIPVIYLLLNKKQLKPHLDKYRETALILLPAILILMFSVYNYQHLPVIDFRPYKIGNNIKVLMKSYDELSKEIPEEKAILDKIPKDKAYDQYKTVYTYEKDGIQKQFTEIPDSSWKWVKTDNTLIASGYHPPIHDFSISNSEEGDITGEVLNDTAKSILIISYKINKADYTGLLSAVKYALDCNQKGIKSYFLTASLQEDINALKDSITKVFNLQADAEEGRTEYVYYYEKDGEIESFTEDNLPDSDEWTFIDKEQISSQEKTEFPVKFYETDETTLKTIIRANPGVVIIKNGVIINKYHYLDLPKCE